MIEEVFSGNVIVDHKRKPSRFRCRLISSRKGAEMARRQSIYGLLFRGFMLAVGATLSSTTVVAVEATVNKITPLPRAHAHNDYYHPRPLLDALSHGFCSVEADVFLVNGQLQVAHSRSELDPGRTLAKLYLDPLMARVEQNGGRVYRDGPPFTLMIDIKSSGTETYRAIHQELAKYRAMLTRVEEGRVVAGAVQVIISGNRDKETIAAGDPRYAGIDGRFSDLDSNLPAHLMPMISDNWRNHFQWRGKGEFPADERAKLREVVRKAHQAGRRVRFWATPESPALWAELDAAGVDAINTDQLSQLEAFLLKPQPN